MWKVLLMMLAVYKTVFSLPLANLLSSRGTITTHEMSIEQILDQIGLKYGFNPVTNASFPDIQLMFQEAKLAPSVINKLLMVLECTNNYQVAHNPILTLIDYSLPANMKRLWVFNLKEKKLLFHTYVSHGIKSGTLFSAYFSNHFNSKASSIGIYKTEQAYYGREGVSLRLEGLDRGFNDNAANRAIVMHGGWYMDPDFINKYGRPGRSWGCPALPLPLAPEIINTIKDQSLLVIYYPNENWLINSKFLSCKNFLFKSNSNLAEMQATEEAREEVLFASVSKKAQAEEGQAILAMPANQYQQLFHQPAPLERMLRRQIDQEEYIALSSEEFKSIARSNLEAKFLQEICFIVPTIRMSRGYYLTEMKKINLGQIQALHIGDSTNPLSQIINYSVYFTDKPLINLKPTTRFIRWLGL